MGKILWSVFTIVVVLGGLIGAFMVARSTWGEPQCYQFAAGEPCKTLGEIVREKLGL